MSQNDLVLSHSAFGANSPSNLLITQESSKRTGNQPLTQTRSSSGMLMSSPAWSRKAWGLSATYLAQFRMRRMASMLVSGKAALQANSERHFTASWNESIVELKYFSKIEAAEERSWHEMHYVKARSTGPKSDRNPPITNARFWFHQINFPNIFILALT